MKIEPMYQLRKTGCIPSYIKETDLLNQYINYFNNFITVEAFAEYYGYTIESAIFVISKGKELNNKKP